MTKITKTFVRTEETIKKYIEFSEKIKRGEEKNDFDTDDLSDRAIKEFQYWIIIENRFPYDAIAKVSHMILPKRKVAFDWGLLTEEELEEFKKLKETYIPENYDVLYENLPKAQTVPKWFHLHLLVLIRK